MKEQLLIMLINAVLKMFTPDLVKDLADRLLDFVEDKVEGSKSTVDDAILLPVCKTIREILDIQE